MTAGEKLNATAGSVRGRETTTARAVPLALEVGRSSRGFCAAVMKRRDYRKGCNFFANTEEPKLFSNSAAIYL
jgi:hypothetical protein